MIYDVTNDAGWARQKRIEMATDVVYKYLSVQNRPYSVNDIVSNLHNEYGKAAVQKALDQLVVEKKIFEKVYGKQKIYCVVQDSSLDIEELMRIDRELQIHANEIESKCQEVEKEIKVQETSLAALKSGLTIEEAREKKRILVENIQSLTRKLDELMEASGTEDLSESKRKADTALKDYSKEYSKRKRMCLDIIDCILENYPGSKKDLYEEIGIELKTVQ